MTQQGYNQPPPPQHPPQYQAYANPEADSIKSMVNIASIFGILMAILGILILVWGLFTWLTFEAVTSGYYDYWGNWVDYGIGSGLGFVWAIYAVWGIIVCILGFLFFAACKKINTMVDQGQYVQAKSKALVWMIIGIIFVMFIPGILLLIAYLKFDPLIRSQQPQHYPPPPQQQAPPPQQQYQQPPPQQQPPQQQQPPPPQHQP